MIGHNLLKSFIERINSLEADKANIAEDIRSIYAEAKSAELNVQALRQAAKRCRMDVDKRQKQATLEETIDQYMSALGVLSDTPLGQAAVEREFG